MKSDSERKKFYKEPLHQRKSRLHVHLSKTLRTKLKTKKRAVLIHKRDKVKIMRGPGMGKEARVTRVNVNRRKVFTDAVMVKNARGTEVAVPLEASNLLLIELEPTQERKLIFKDEAFIKVKEVAKPKEETKKEEKSEAKAEHKPEHKATEHAHTHEKESEPKTHHESHEHKVHDSKSEHKEHDHKHESEHKDHEHKTEHKENEHKHDTKHESEHKHPEHAEHEKHHDKHEEHKHSK